MIRDVSAATWLENGDAVTELLKQNGTPIPPRSKDGVYRIGYCKPTRDPIETGLLAARLGINPHCILTDQQRLMRSARKGDRIICLTPDSPSKVAMRYLAGEGVEVELAPRP